MSKRILVIEDQEDLRGVLRDLLTGSGYEVAEAADGRDGVAKAKSQRPDLILMDIAVPLDENDHGTPPEDVIDTSPQHAAQVMPQVAR